MCGILLKGRGGLLANEPKDYMLMSSMVTFDTYLYKFSTRRQKSPGIIDMFENFHGAYNIVAF